MCRQSEKNLLNSKISPTSLQYGELLPTNGWDILASLGHPSKFQRVSHLGSATARHSSSGRHPNFAALNTASPIFGRAAITLGIGQHSSFCLFSSPNISGRRLDVYDTSTHDVALVQNACVKCAARGSLNIQTQKIAILAPSHNFVGLYLHS